MPVSDNTFPNPEEVKAIKTLWTEQYKRREPPMEIAEILDRGCIYRPRLGIIVLEEVLDNLEKLRKRLQ